MGKLAKYCLLTILFFLCAIPIISQAQDDEIYFSDHSTYLSYHVIDTISNYVSVSAVYRDISGDVIIPATVSYNDITYTVTEIDGFSICYQLGNVVLPNTITTIADGAFNYSSLSSITIPSSVTYIGCTAFDNCYNLTNITFLPQTPPTLCEYAFSDIHSNATFYVPNESYLTANNWSNILTTDNTVIDMYYTPNSLGLRTNRWNFVAGTGHKADIYNNNNPVSFVSTFTADNTINDITNLQNPHCDIAIVYFNSLDNNWASDFLYAYEKMEVGYGYFVWVFSQNCQGKTITNDATMTNIDMTGKYMTSDSVYVEYINTGNTNTSGTATAAKWFAFGNPFDKKLNKNDILEKLPRAVNDILYTYDALQSQWISTNTTILPGQGFMVASYSEEADKVSGFLNYPTTTNSAPAQPESYGIRFSVNANGISSDMFAKQENNAQDGFDTKDAYALFGNNENLVEPYFVVEGRQIIHNRYNSDNYACDVNFHCQKSGVAELSVSDVPEGTTVSIVDLTMNTETVLESEPYQIDVEAGENSGRYQIKINKGSVSLPQTIENEANITIWNNNKEIFVKGEYLQRVEVYNTLGQMVYQREVSGESYNFTFDNEGAYIVKAAAKNGIKTQKIIIR